MKNLGRYLNKCWSKSECYYSNKILIGKEPIQRRFGLQFPTTRFFSEDSSEVKSSDKSTQDQSEKKTKHIYKRKEQKISQNENLDVIRSETHFYREGFSNGIHVREEVNYVCYELPSEGRQSESKGKSEEKTEEKSQSEDKKQNEEKSQSGDKK